jgi:hypothetical protein
MLLQSRTHATHRASMGARNVGKRLIGIESREELLVLLGTPLFTGIHTGCFAR